MASPISFLQKFLFLPAAFHPVLYLKEIYGIPPNSLLPSTSRLSYMPYSSETFSHFDMYVLGGARFV
jgi:hypothetical protein